MGQGSAVLAAGKGLKLSDFNEGTYFNFNGVLPGN